MAQGGQPATKNKHYSTNLYPVACQPATRLNELLHLADPDREDVGSDSVD